MSGLSLKEMQLMRKIMKSMPGSIRHTDLMRQLREAKDGQK